MQPLFNSFLPVQNQNQSNTTIAPLHQQAFQSNPSLANSCAMLPNSMQMQSQMGIINPQLPIPINNSNMPPLIAQAGFMNAPSQPFLPQNNHLGMPQFPPTSTVSQPGQFNVGFGPQLGLPNLNNVFMGQFCNPMQNANQVNPSQLQGQFMHNLSNMAKQLNQNMGFPNRQQFSLQNPVQNINQFLPMQMPNPSQGVPYGIPPCSQPLAGCPSPNFFGNPQFGLVNPNPVGQHLNQNQQNLVQRTMDINALNSPQVQVNSSTPFSSSSIHPQQNQNAQPSVFNRSQGQPVKNCHINSSGSNGKNFSGKRFTKNPKSEVSRRGFQQSQFHQADNAKRKFGFSNEHKGKGRCNERAAKLSRCDSENPAREKKRSRALIYTEQEIQQWCEERRKNYPSKTNIEKKLNEKLADSKSDKEAKIRREQLKEILAKQAELGFEIPEIPLHYFSDSERQLYTKHDKKRRYSKKDKFRKKQKLSNISSLSTKSPTLLQKLLSADLKRDKCLLLQVFRFMLMNSFFKDCPEKPLKFPLVVVKESGCEDEVVEEKSLLGWKDISDGSNKIMVAENLDADADADEHNAQVEQVSSDFVKRRESIEEEVGKSEEEEGEIID